MTKFLTATAIAAATLVAAPAAAEVGTGGRVEALVGYDKLKAAGEKEGGILYGIGAGYDFAAGNGFALGVDIEATDSTTDVGNDTVYAKTGRDLYAGGRASFALNQSLNAYVKAGYTNARFKASDGIITVSDNLDGYRLGAGLQTSLGGNAYAGGEYRYSNYDDGVERHQLALTVGTRF